MNNIEPSTRALIDTGADISCIAESYFNSIPGKIRPTFKSASFSHVKGVGGEIHNVLGLVNLNLQIDGYMYKHDFHVISHLHHHVIIGDDFLEKNKAIIDRGNKTLQLENGEEIKQGEDSEVSMVRTCTSISLPPLTEAIVPVKLSKHKSMCIALVEPLKQGVGNNPLMIAKTVANVEKGKTMCRILNYSEETVYLNPGTVVAKASQVNEDLISTLEDDYPSINMAENGHSIKPTLSKEEAIACAKELGINLENPALTPENKTKLLELIGRNRDVFATNLTELGKTNLHTHKIETGDALPVRQRPYRNSPKVEQEMNRQVEEMEAIGIIEPSTSMWQSPVVMVKKKGGSDMRFAVDYRNLNRVTKQISFPLPTLENVFDKLGQAQANWFTTLDLASGFWQVPLHPETKEKTTFITNYGQKYNFTVLPFGLVNAPSTYQMVMDKVLQGLNWKILLCYIDDIIIFSNNFDEHLQHLDLVFQRLRKANLTLKPSKCTFSAQRVMYLGHYLSRQGIEVDPTKVDAVKNFPQPKNPKSVRSFIGLCSFYRRFIKDFSKIAVPLHKLTVKDAPYEWTEKCEEAFQMLKNAMTSTPVLRFPDWNRPFILTTDASTTALSYILGQKDDKGKEFAIAYGGRSLKGAELNYKIHELECLALVEGVRAYHHYLSNQPFTAITDNIAVKWLKTAHHSNPRLLRWSLCLQGYQYTIQHRAGVLNKNADALSRRDYNSSDSPLSKVTEDCLDEVAIFAVNAQSPDPNEDKLTNLPSFQTRPQGVEVEFEYANDSTPKLPVINTTSGANLALAQKECPDFSDIYTYLESGEVPKQQKLAHKVLSESNHYVLDDGVLFHIFTPRGRKISNDQAIIRQLAVPTNWREDVLLSYHDSLLGGGHQGFDRTYAAIRLKYYWPKMYAQIFDYVKTCDPCQHAKRHFQAHPAPLQNMPVVGRFDRWHMDILGPLSSSSEGHKYILVIVDSYTRWPEAFPLKSQEAEEISKVLYREIFSRYGAPRALLSDRGQNFMSKLVTAICQMFQVTRLHTSSYHPATNATCERLNSTLGQAMRAYCPNSNPDWPNCLPGILMAYRMTPATQSTSLSPYFMVFGQQMQLPFDTALKPQDTLPVKTQAQLKSILENLRLAEKIANENLDTARKASKSHYDKKAKLPPYQIGDSVLLYNPKVPKGESRKTHIKWVGPYYITTVLDHYNYILRDSKSHKEHKSPVHANRLKPYYNPIDRIIPPTQDVLDQPLPILAQGNNPAQGPQNTGTPMQPAELNPSQPEEERVYEAERLLGMKVRGGKKYYRVKWKQSLNLNPSWETEDNISDHLIRHFHIYHTKTGKRRKRQVPLTK